ncbi:MAG: Zn-dependent exopeptidase M28 [Spirochaetaceae bacterium]|jgi:hypothetical protein|nr:Zn-dependent exopeptidase M28 [Spirochaetaceae bacterium]
MDQRRVSHAQSLQSRGAPYHKFSEFINPVHDRFTVLNALLSELDFHYSVVQFGDSRHFFVSSTGKERPARVLAAHYDSVTGSPGANDNASSVFILVRAALELKKKTGIPWMVIFTDNEELAGEKGIRAQGSYLLGRGLKNTDLAGADFFVFDSCGRGDTLIISTTADYIMKKETGGGIATAQKKLKDLRNNAMLAAEHSSQQHYMLLPTPFSDDAGFLHAGLAAQMITTLPGSEAAAFASLSRANPRYTHALFNRDLQKELDMTLLPATWNRLNGPEDTEEFLTPEYFAGMVKFAITLARRT